MSPRPRLHGSGRDASRWDDPTLLAAHDPRDASLVAMDLAARLSRRRALARRAGTAARFRTGRNQPGRDHDGNGQSALSGSPSRTGDALHPRLATGGSRDGATAVPGRHVDDGRKGGLKSADRLAAIAASGRYFEPARGDARLAGRPAYRPRSDRSLFRSAREFQDAAAHGGIAARAGLGLRAGRRGGDATETHDCRSPGSAEHRESGAGRRGERRLGGLALGTVGAAAIAAARAVRIERGGPGPDIRADTAIPRRDRFRWGAGSTSK